MKFTTFNNALMRALFVISCSLVILIACDDDDPEREDTPELITNVSLIFTPSAGGTR